MTFLEVKPTIIVDFADHYKCIRYVTELVGDSHPIQIFLTVPVEDRQRLDALIDPDSTWFRRFLLSGKRKLYASRSPNFLPRLFLQAFHSRLIYIVTGPEHASPLVNLAFLILLRTYGHKCIVAVRNPYLWLEETSRASSIRSRALRYASLVTFESETQEDSFLEKVGSSHLQSSTFVYDGYLSSEESSNSWHLGIKDQTIRIGLLGTLNPTRRDYASLVRALRQYRRSYSQLRIHLVCLGAFLPGLSEDVVSNLKSVTSVSVSEGWLEAGDLLELGRSCHALLAPLSQDKPYGTLAGSGCFGDALFLRRRLIVPRFADPMGEFKDISLTYGSHQELADILTSFPLHKGLDEDALHRFDIGKALQRLKNGAPGLLGRMWD